MQTNVVFTQAASAYIKKMLAKAPGTSFRLSIKKTGCSGYSYLPSTTDKILSSDTPLIISDDVTIYLDTTWLHLLEGVQVDYVEEEKSGLKQKRLLFTNEKESGRCGCGESFHIE
jgi:iron-sulfur cluster assembly protein